MTKKLALRERRRERRTIYGHKRLVSPGAAAVQEPSPEFLARASLAAHEHSALDLGCPLDRSGDPPHGRIRPEHPIGLEHRFGYAGSRRHVFHDGRVERPTPRIAAGGISSSETQRSDRHLKRTPLMQHRNTKT